VALVLIASGVLIRAGIVLASNASAFWTKSPRNSFGLMVHGLSDFAKYPITIYSTTLQGLVTIAVPYAFIGFFPATYLFGKGGLGFLGLLSPLVAAYCAAMAVFVFNRGLRKYESTGN